MTKARATLSPSTSKRFLAHPPGTSPPRANAFDTGFSVCDSQLHLRPFTPPLRNLGRERAPCVIELGEDLQQLFVCTEVGPVAGIIRMDQGKNHAAQRLDPARLGRPN